MIPRSTPQNAPYALRVRDMNADRAIREYVVIGVDHALLGGAVGEPAPPELLERFEGRTFSLKELEERGVRVAGAKLAYTANGQDWFLRVSPPIGQEHL